MDHCGATVREGFDSALVRLREHSRIVDYLLSASDHPVQIRFRNLPEFGRSEFHHGIEAETNEKCPAWTYSWKSWTGVAFWEQDDYFRINCQNGEI